MQWKFRVIILCFIAILTSVFLPGCVPKVAIPQNLKGLSLVIMWDTVAKATHVQNDSVELESFRLLTNSDGKMDGLTFIFREDNTSSIPKAYQADVSSKGELTWHSYQAIFPRTRHPLDVLTEIDKFNLASLKTGESGLCLQADFTTDNSDYSSECMNIYQLDKGNLLPLREIDFNGATTCIISIYQCTNGGETLSQSWFLSADINHAKTVKYLQ